MEYNEEDEDMGTDEEDKEKENYMKEDKSEKKEKSDGKKWKREEDSDEKKKRNHSPKKEVIPLAPIHHQPQGQEIVGVVGAEGEGATDEKRKARKVCNVGNLEILKGIFGNRKWEEN